MSSSPVSKSEDAGATNGVGMPANRASDVSGITPSQRAAVIIAMLGESAAKPIVDKLDDHALADVAAALENISFLARGELVEIVVDFLTHLRRMSGALRGSKSMAREIISGILEPDRLSAVLGETAVTQEQSGEDGTVWSRLERKEPLQVAEYLNGLSANLVALILRQQDVSIASDILCHLNDDKLGPVLGYMIETRDVDPGIETVIERMVEMEFLNVEQGTSEEDETHLESIGELLSLIPGDKRDSLVEFLQGEHAAKLESIQKAIFTIEGLPDLLSRKMVPIVFRELDMAVLIKLLGSLRETHTPVADYLLGNISSRMADQIRDDLTDFVPLSAEESEGLQRDFLTDLMALKRRGLITLEKPTANED